MKANAGQAPTRCFAASLQFGLALLILGTAAHAQMIGAPPSPPGSDGTTTSRDGTVPSTSRDSSRQNSDCYGYADQELQVGTCLPRQQYGRHYRPQPVPAVPLAPRPPTWAEQQQINRDRSAAEWQRRTGASQ